jgi:tRNA-2-methylthio-N6-dimethylallyladenosine synthase
MLEKCWKAIALIQRIIPEMSTLKNKTFYIHTFGCQMNENDSERIAGYLQAEGAKKTDVIENSDVIIINTCAVREKSVEKLYSLLGRVAQIKNHKKILLGVAGCVAQLYRSRLITSRPFIDFVIGPDNYHLLVPRINSIEHDKIVLTERHRHWENTPPTLFSREHPVIAYITIMEGCNNFCTYCIVPFTRGREKYRPKKAILEEAAYLSAQGYKEIQLLGQNVNSYLDPDSDTDFNGLLEEVDKIKSLEWVRFITSHPKNFNLETARIMKDSEKICPQLHLPVQAGSNSVLKRMKRGYNREEYLEKIHKIKELMPDINLSTDIIVGFPGETDKDFQKTLDVLQEVEYSNIFSFRYSPRPYTKASLWEDSVPLSVKRERLIQVQSLQKNIQLKNNRKLIGSRMKVLCTGFSKKDKNKYNGRNQGFQVINFYSDNDSLNQFVNVQITGCGPYSLHGNINITAIPKITQT